MYAPVNKRWLSVILISTCCAAKAQLIDYTSTFRTIHDKSYFRFHYDNDYFTKTDYYYTQGITLEYVHPSIKKFIFTKILVRPAGNDFQYGIAFNIFGYTPTSIRSNNILYGDRPYASCMSFKTFAIASDSIKQQRVSSAISIGVIGPAAQGEEIQTGIHRWLKNVLPKGWQYQVKNDVIINYEISFEKKLFGANSYFLLNGIAESKLGTLNDKLGAGFNFMTGNFNHPYQTARPRKKKLEYYLYGQSRADIIGYDASMQGGVFNHQSPYTIPAGDISRVVFRADAGIVFNFKKLHLSYTQSYLTKEFHTGSYHRWGGVSFGLSL